MIDRGIIKRLYKRSRDRGKEAGMKEIPEWQCGPKGGNWEHMGQILPKLTERQQEKEAGQKEKKVLMFGVRGAWFEIIPLFPRLLTVTLFPALSLRSFRVRARQSYFIQLHCPLKGYLVCSSYWNTKRGTQWIINTYKSRRARKLQNNKQAKDLETRGQQWCKVPVQMYKH